jgi:uncharacterized protein YqjF (DUF2071 family)
MFQRWINLLFAHWPVPVEVLRPMIPSSLTIDTFEDQAWLGITPFQMSSVHPRYLPPLPSLSYFPELNVRTYVVNRVGDERKPGIWFFSLDAGNLLAVWAARLGYRLPYFHARMDVSHTPTMIEYTSRRTHRGAKSAEFVASYRPVGPVYHAPPDSLDYWFTERYCLYTTDRLGRLYRGEIHHPPWPLQQAEADIRVNTTANATGIDLPNIPPLLHFAPRQDMVGWYLRQVTNNG